MGQEVRELENRSRDARAKCADMNTAAKLKQKELQTTNTELKEFSSAEGQLLSKLEKVSPETAEAWKWVQANQDLFANEVYGPPLVTCSLKDPRCASAVESLFSSNHFLAFTVQSGADWSLLMRKLVKEQNFAQITIKQASSPLSEFGKRNVSQENMQRYGFDGWAVDLIDGPEPVLAMLCDQIKLHITAVGKTETNEEQHALILQSGINTWVTGKHKNNIIRRQEYGASAVTVSTKTIKAAEIWTDSPIDNSKKQEIQSRIDAITEVLAQMGRDIIPVRAELDNAKKAIDEKKAEEVRQLIWLVLPELINLFLDNSEGREEPKAESLFPANVYTWQNW